MNIGIMFEQFLQNICVVCDCSKVYGSVVGVISLFEQGQIFVLEQFCYCGKVFVLDGIVQSGEGGFGWVEESFGFEDGVGWVGEGWVDGFGYFVMEGLGQFFFDFGDGKVWEGEEVGQFGEGGFGGEIEIEDDVGVVELCFWCVDGRNEVVDVLVDVYDDDFVVYGVMDDGC